MFGSSKFLKEYPYFLPCAVPATFAAFAWLLTILFLKEVCDSPWSWAQRLTTERSNRLIPHRSPFESSFVERKSESDQRRILFSPLKFPLRPDSRILYRFATFSREM